MYILHSSNNGNKWKRKICGAIVYIYVFIYTRLRVVLQQITCIQVPNTKLIVCAYYEIVF